MKLVFARNLLLCAVSGCGAVAQPPDGTSPHEEAAPHAASAPAVESKRQTAAAVPKSPAREAPAPIAAAKPSATPPVPGSAARPAALPAPAGRQAAPSTLDLGGLKQQLKDTDAIGVMTKLSLKNQVDDLLQQFRDYYGGKTQLTLQQLRRSYDTLLMKVLTLVQDRDTRLATSIVASREPIWGLLSDPKKFAALAV